jgi:hypothetical protein
MKPIEEMNVAELDQLSKTSLSGEDLIKCLRRLEKLQYDANPGGNEYCGDLKELEKVATISGVRDNWVWGTIDGYFFEAKVFATGSDYGIKNGRVSKLSIREDSRGDSVRFVSYDRGWDVRPKRVVTKTYNKLLKALKCPT